MNTTIVATKPIATGLITSIESPLDRLNAPRKRGKKPGK